MIHLRAAVAAVDPGGWDPEVCCDVEVDCSARTRLQDADGQLIREKGVPGSGVRLRAAA